MLRNARIAQTDVLVIGGGMAGCFASIKAADAGAEVALVDKGYVSCSGQTPYANSFIVFDPAKGHDKQAWMKQISAGGDYFNNRKWTEIILDGSLEAYQDLVSFGVATVMEEDGTVRERSLEELGPCTAIFPDMKHAPGILRQEILKRRVQIFDKVMIVELLKDESGRIAGAAGFTVLEAAPVVFLAKNTIICTGAASVKPQGWPISELTADGDMMALRAGASITGKEFVDVHTTAVEEPAYQGPLFMKRPTGNPPPPPRFTNAEGKECRTLSFHMGCEFEAHAGRAPITGKVTSSLPKPGGGLMPSVPVEICGGASAGMSTHKAEGIWAVGYDCKTELPGLYAAGDSLGAMTTGAAYSAIGIALTGSAVQGAIAGRTAAEEAKTIAMGKVPQEQIDKVFDEIFDPIERVGGFKPSWVIQLLQNAMMPYFVFLIKREDRLKIALAQIEYYKSFFVPQLKAKDPHELRLAIEAKNMIWNAEIKLKAALLRKESRGTHYREDYPQRDDEHFNIWLKARLKDGELVFEEEPIPEEWRRKPDEEFMFEFPVFEQEGGN